MGRYCTGPGRATVQSGLVVPPFQDRAGQLDRIDGFGHIMHPQNRRATLSRQHRSGNRGGQPLVGIVTARHGTKHGLARDTDQQRRVECKQLLLTAQQGQVMLKALAEAESRIDGEVIARNAGCHAGFDPFGQEIPDLDHDILVAGVLLHGTRLTLHVHHADRHGGFGCSF
jgi:hypothetical protein